MYPRGTFPRLASSSLHPSRAVTVGAKKGTTVRRRPRDRGRGLRLGVTSPPGTVRQFRAVAVRCTSAPCLKGDTREWHVGRPSRHARPWSPAVSEPAGPPDGEQPAVRRGGPVFGPGAERSTGRACVKADDSEDEARRAAGGPGPKSSTRAERSPMG